MNSENMEYVSIDINRRPIVMVGVVFAVAGSIFMFVLTTSFGAELWEVVVFSLLPYVLILGAILGSLIVPMEIGAGPKGLQIVFKPGRKLDLGWKDVVSIQPSPKSEYYHLKYRRRDGSFGVYALTEEAANHVQQIWSSITGYDMAQ
jgi:hypothetical protein